MRTIQQLGGTLFGVAAQYLNDATQWFRIAQLNNINDPWRLFGVATVSYPILADDRQNPIVDEAGDDILLGPVVETAIPLTLIIPDPIAAPSAGIPTQ